MLLKTIFNSFVKQLTIKNSLFIKTNLTESSIIHKKKGTLWTINNCYSFSVLESDKNPIQNPKPQSKKKSNIEQIPILKQILELSSQQQLKNVYKKLNFMSKQHRQISLKYLLSSIFKGRVPFRVIQSMELNIFLNQFANLKMQRQLFLINYLLSQLMQKKKKSYAEKQGSTENEKQISDVYNRLNDLFLNAFTNTLNQLPQQYVGRSRAILYKHFAQYNFMFLFNPQAQIDQNAEQFNKNYSFLKKSREFLTESLIYHKQIILQEYKKLQNEDINNLKENDKQRYLIKVNAIKQNIRKLVQSIGECLNAIVIITYKQYKWTKDLRTFSQNKLQASGLIQTYISLYSIFDGIKPLSKLYFKLRSIGVDCKATALAVIFSAPQNRHKLNQNKQKFRDILIQSDNIYKQCQDYLPQVAENFDNLKQLSAVMLNVKYRMGRSKNKNQQSIKKQLALVVHHILQKVKTEWKKPTQAYLLNLIKEIIKKQEVPKNLTM